MFTVETGAGLTLGTVKSLFAFSGLEKSPLAGVNFTAPGSSFGSIAQGLNSINMGTVAGASAQSAGAFDFVIMYAALMVFLLGSLYLLHEKRLA